jgi:hypothetical protein
MSCSGLDADVAGEIGRPSDDLKRVEEQETLTYLAEMEFLKANLAVFNAKNYRRDPLVPLVVPTVNLPHLEVIPHQ